MITICKGDLLTSSAQTLVNTVNCVGVMGKGIALLFKNRFPEMFEDYRRRCEAGEVRLGQPYVWRGLLPPQVLNFPTKDHWRSVSRLEDIVAGLDHLEAHYREWGITSLAVPPLGCGNGQLEWRVVGPTLYRHLSRLDIPIELYPPPGTAASEVDPAFLAGGSTVAPAADPTRIPAAWVALAAVVARIEQEPHHWPVGRTTFQKIAYFATAEGVPTGLSFGRGSYGPFAPAITPMVTKLVNNGLLVEEQTGRMHALRPGPTLKDAVRHFRADIERWADVLRRVTDLFLRLQTRDAEVAATVAFAAHELTARGQGPVAESQVLAEVQAWKQNRRPPIAAEDFGTAIRHLNMLGWVNLSPSADLPLPADGF